MIQQNKLVRVFYLNCYLCCCCAATKSFPQGDQGDKGDRGLTTTFKGDQFPTGIIEGPPGPPGPAGMCAIFNKS